MHDVLSNLARAMTGTATIEIHIKLSLYFKKYTPVDTSEFSWEISPGTTVDQLVTTLGISKDSMFLVNVNGRMATLTQTLSQGDLVVIFPPVQGG